MSKKINNQEDKALDKYIDILESENYKSYLQELKFLQDDYAEELSRLDGDQGLAQLISEEISKWTKNHSGPMSEEEHEEMIIEIYREHAPKLFEYLKKELELKEEFGIPEDLY